MKKQSRSQIHGFFSIALVLVLLLVVVPDAQAVNIQFTARDDIGNPVSGAEFLLHDQYGNSTPAASASNGVVNFTNLSAGKYVIVMTGAPTGYTLNSAAQANFDVLSNGEVAYTQDPAQTLILQRATSPKVFPIRDTNGVPVEGAVFNVASQDGRFTKNFTSTASGLELDLPEGTYTITNVQVPSSHMINPASCTVTVSRAGAYTFTRNPTDVFQMDIGKNTLSFRKMDDGGNPVSGAVFHLAGTGVNATATSNSSGIVTFTVLAEGSYVLSERSAPDGYIKSSSTVNIDVDTTGAITYVGDRTPDNAFVNQRAKYDMTFALRNDAGSAVAGATFKLESKSNSFEAESELGTGRVLFTDVPFGVYSLSQATTAEGYPASSSKVIVTIYPDGGISFSENPSVAFTAERTRFAFSFTAKEERGGNLEGATFQLKSENGQLTKTEKSITGGKVNFYDILPGKYTLSQTATPAGYSPSETTVDVKVADDGTVTFSRPPETYIVASIAKYTVSFDKMDDIGAPVQGAVFRLVGENYERDVTSSKEGRVSFPGLTSGTYTLTERSAPAGYAKSNASITVTVGTTGTTSYSSEPVLTFANTRTQYGFDFVTVDEQGNGVRGATFQLEGTGKTVEADSNRKGHVTFAKLPHGSYILSEKSAPTGYVKSPLTVGINIATNGEIIHEIIQGEGLPNTPVQELDGLFVNTSGPISFSFTAFAEDMSALPLAEFSLTNAQNGSTVVAMSNAGGVAAFYGMQPGEYRLRQSGAPIGMIPSRDEYRITVDVSGELSLYPAAAHMPGADDTEPTFTGTLSEEDTQMIPALSFVSDYEKRTLTLNCTDIYSNVPVAGAIFLLRAPDGNDAGIVITGQTGSGTINTLRSGVTYGITAVSVPSGYQLPAPETALAEAHIPEEGTPEPVSLTLEPIAAETSVAPEGILAAAIDFAKNNTAGLIAAGTGMLMLAAFVAMLIKGK